jgi:hypothetical protein
MNINDLTIGEAKALAKMFGNNSCDDSPYEIGKNYLIRTVTMIDTGRLVAVTPQELVLEDAAWIADTGRFSDSLATCNFNEVEPYPAVRVIIGRGTVVEALQIAKLPKEKK